VAEVKYNSDKGTPEKRITDRLKNSGEGSRADVTTKTGDSARRTFHNIHFSGFQHNSRKNAGGEPPKGGV